MMSERFVEADSSSSAASSYAAPTHEPVVISPKQFNFFHKFENEKDINKHSLAIMNTFPQSITVTVMCSHPTLVQTVALDGVRVSPHSKVQSQLVQYPPSRSSKLAMLHITTWIKGQKMMASEHFLPIYINCRPSNDTLRGFRALKSKMFMQLRDSVSASGLSSSEQDVHDSSEHLTDTKVQEVLLPHHNSSQIIRSESGDLSTISRNRTLKTIDYVVLSQISRSNENISKVCPEVTSEDLFHRRESRNLSKSSSRVNSEASSASPPPTTAGRGYRDSGRKASLPRKRLPTTPTSKPSFDICDKQTYQEQFTDTPVTKQDCRRNITTDTTPYKDKKISTIPTSAERGQYRNDVLLCWTVMLLTLGQLLYNWWRGEFNHMNFFTLSAAVQNTFITMSAFFVCIGYLICVFTSGGEQNPSSQT